MAAVDRSGLAEELVVTAIDDQLDDACIIRGLGDAGDRLYGDL